VGQFIRYCDGCQERMVEGKAVQEGAKFFCTTCRPDARPSPPTPPAARAPAVDPPPVRPPTRRGLPSDVNAAVARRSGRAVIAVGAIAVFIVVIAAVILLGRGNGGAAASTADVAIPPGDNPDARVANDVETFAAKAEPRAIIEKCDAALAQVSRPPERQRILNAKGAAQKRIDDAEDAARAERETKAAEQEVGDLLARAREIAGTDPTFARLAEVRLLHGQARSRAGRRENLIAAVGAAEVTYQKGFDEAAEAAWKPLAAEADALSAAGNPLGAVAAIDKFPNGLRQGEWAQRVQNQKGAYRAKMAAAAADTVLDEYGRANGAFETKEWAKAIMLYRGVLARLEKTDLVRAQGVDAEREAEVRRRSHLNMARCMAMQGADAEVVCRALDAAVKAGLPAADLANDTHFQSIKGADAFVRLVGAGSATTVDAIRRKAETTRDFAGLVADCGALPADVRADAARQVQDVLRARYDAACTRIAAWQETLKPLLDRKSTMEQARADVAASDAAARPAAQRRLQAIWATRAQNPIKVDAAIREIAADLDGLEKVGKPDKPWRAKFAPAAPNACMETLALDTIALTDDERDVLAKSAALEKAKVPPVIDKLNDYRVMLGRVRLAHGEELVKLAQWQANAKGKAAKVQDRAKGFVGELDELCLKARSADEMLATVLGGADHARAIDGKWTVVGLGTTSEGYFALSFGAPK